MKDSFKMYFLEMEKLLSMEGLFEIFEQLVSTIQKITFY